MNGRSIGNYRVIEKLSEGGMGEVFRAEHVLIGVTVVVPRSDRTHVVEVQAPWNLPATSEVKNDVDSRIEVALSKEEVAHVEEVEAPASRPKKTKKRPRKPAGSGSSSGPIETDI